MRVGFHVSISDSVDKAVDRAVALGCNTFQMFTSNPRGWKARALRFEEIESFKKKVISYDMKPVFGHMPYLSNLASPRQDIYAKSVATLVSEMKRCHSLEIPFLVTHLGSHLGFGIEAGFKRIVKAIDTSFSLT